MKILAELKKKKPLVHHITNQVTIGDCANIALAVGALPVMSHSIDEVEDMVSLASALVLNIGTLTKEQVDAMLKAGKKANELNIPIVLDPVGAGATKYRTEKTLELIREVKPAIIKGNQGEITIIAGENAEVKGVESVGEYKDIMKTAERLAKETGAVVVVSGVEDIVTDGKETYVISNGDEKMGIVVGTGCMLGSVLGSFVGAGKQILDSAVEAVGFYGIAGEEAAKLDENAGPQKFKVEFMDQIYKLTPESLQGKMKVKKA